MILLVSFVLDLPTEHLHVVKHNCSEACVAWVGTVGLCLSGQCILPTRVFSPIFTYFHLSPKVHCVLHREASECGLDLVQMCLIPVVCLCR